MHSQHKPRQSHYAYIRVEIGHVYRVYAYRYNVAQFVYAEVFSGNGRVKPPGLWLSQCSKGKRVHVACITCTMSCTYMYNYCVGAFQCLYVLVVVIYSVSRCGAHIHLVSLPCGRSYEKWSVNGHSVLAY